MSENLLANEDTDKLVTMFYDACVSGRLEVVGRLANILYFRGGDAIDKVREAFAANCTISGRTHHKLPKVST